MEMDYIPEEEAVWMNLPTVPILFTRGAKGASSQKKRFPRGKHHTVSWGDHLLCTIKVIHPSGGGGPT